MNRYTKYLLTGVTVISLSAGMAYAKDDSAVVAGNGADTTIITVGSKPWRDFVIKYFNPADIKIIEKHVAKMTPAKRKMFVKTIEGFEGFTVKRGAITTVDIDKFLGYSDVRRAQFVRYITNHTSGKEITKGIITKGFGFADKYVSGVGTPTGTKADRGKNAAIEKFITNHKDLFDKFDHAKLMDIFAKTNGKERRKLVRYMTKHKGEITTIDALQSKVNDIVKEYKNHRKDHKKAHGKKDHGKKDHKKKHHKKKHHKKGSVSGTPKEVIQETTTTTTHETVEMFNKTTK